MIEQSEQIRHDAKPSTVIAVYLQLSCAQSDVPLVDRRAYTSDAMHCIALHHVSHLFLLELALTELLVNNQ